MFKSTLFKMATPIVCALSMAFTSLSAAPYYGNNCADDCCDPCQNKRGWWKDAAIFVGAAAVGAVAGVAAANSNKHHGKRGEIGPQGPQGNPGTPGTPGTPGIGFTPAVVPPGQPNAGAPVTSLTFTFTTLVAISLPGNIQSYVTTPDGRTILGTTFSGVVGSTSTVTIPTGPFFSGQYDVGVILPASVIALAGLVKAEITNINGVATAPALDDAGIVVAASVLALTTDTFFNAQYPFPETP